MAHHDHVCESCEVERAVVYCKSDAARLCLQCDGRIHSANTLSCSHLRSLVCDKCGSQAAVFRCLADKMTLCQLCHFSSCCLGHGHPRVKLSFYKGCPSPAEFSTILSLVLNGGRGSLSGRVATNRLNKIAYSVKFRQLGIVPHPPHFPSRYMSRDQRLRSFKRAQTPFLCQESTLLKGCANSNVHENKNLSGSVDMDEMALSLATDDEMCGIFQNQHCDDGGIDGLLVEKSLSGTESNSTCKESVLKASPSKQQDCAGFKPSIGHGFSSGEVPSSISLSQSNTTGETSGDDYLDFGSLPLLPKHDWLEESYFKAKMRYNEKKRKRGFGEHSIRYASGKARADTRNRKGRFFKTENPYDFDEEQIYVLTFPYTGPLDKSVATAIDGGEICAERYLVHLSRGVLEPPHTDQNSVGES